MTFSKGDDIIIVCDGRKVDGEIMMASEKNFALMVKFDTILAGHVQMMPVFLVEGDVYRSVVDNTKVIIRRRLHA
jgi:hypothetical protein